MEYKHPLAGKKQSREHIEKRAAQKRGIKLSPEHKLKISIGMKKLNRKLFIDEIQRRTETRRKNGWNKNPELTHQRQSENNAHARLGVKSSDETRFKQSLALRGEKNHNWRGGITEVHEKIRKSSAYQIWRSNILKRDNYTCQICGVQDEELQVDHIKPFALYPELRTEPSNGRTLCIPCHRKTDTWGYRKIYRTLVCTI